MFKCNTTDKDAAFIAAVEYAKNKGFSYLAVARLGVSLDWYLRKFDLNTREQLERFSNRVNYLTSIRDKESGV